jgi:hypothetical protein
LDTLTARDKGSSDKVEYGKINFALPQESKTADEIACGVSQRKSG